MKNGTFVLKLCVDIYIEKYIQTNGITSFVKRLLGVGRKMHVTMWYEFVILVFENGDNMIKNIQINEAGFIKITIQ